MNVIDFVTALCALVFLCSAVSCAADQCAQWGTCSADGKLISQRNLTSKHYWPRARGNPVDYMRTSYTIPFDLKSAFKWSWTYPEGRFTTIMRGNPLIDDKKNIYILTEMGLFKLDSIGNIIWRYRVPSGALMEVVPCIWEDAIIGNSIDSTAYSVDLDTGKENWVKNFNKRIGGDTSYVEAIDGVALTAIDDPGSGGNRLILALNTSNGDKIWEYRVEKTLWNFNPVFHGDGTFITMDVTGGTYKFGLFDGKLMWHSAVNAFPYSFTDGGVMIGPDGTSYACSNNEYDEKGALRAYGFSDGKLLWEKLLPTGCTSWPAISTDGSWGALAVGHFVSEPVSMRMPQYTPRAIRALIWKLSLALGEYEQYLPILWGEGKSRNVRTYIISFDTKTGDSNWEYRVPDYKRIAGRGDDYGLGERYKAISEGRGHSLICLPTSWGTPTISGDNTVHVGHASGTLYAVKDMNGDKFIDPKTDVSTYDILASPLPNNPAWAPGIMAIATCDSMFVFGN